eukprot:scaffold148552_cov27-Tisochrysis_lutea.AAC.1
MILVEPSVYNDPCFANTLAGASLRPFLKTWTDVAAHTTAYGVHAAPPAAASSAPHCESCTSDHSEDDADEALSLDAAFGRRTHAEATVPVTDLVPREKLAEVVDVV